MRRSMFTASFWLDAGERAIRTVAQTLIGALAGGFVVTDTAQWKAALIASGVAGLTSLLMSLAATRVGNSESPSFVDEGTR
jgi:hypothetical protein